MPRNSLIIAGYPGVGKSYCFKHGFENLVISDSDSSKFPKENFPENYIQHIKSLVGVKDVIFVSTHKEVLKALDAAGLPFWIVYPDRSLKAEYMKRYKYRGSPEGFIKLMDDKWEEFHDDLSSFNPSGTIKTAVITNPRKTMADVLSDILKLEAPLPKPSWHETFFEICEVLAKRSDDLVTKLGCVIVSPEKEIVASGYNGLPRGIESLESRLIRPAKYMWTEHAEKNAIVNATRYGATLKNCILYCTWPPCSACARSIIQAGIAEVHFKDIPLKEKWRDSMDTSMEMLYEAGLTCFVHRSNGEITEYKKNTGKGVVLSFMDKPVSLTYKENDPDETGKLE